MTNCKNCGANDIVGSVCQYCKTDFSSESKCRELNTSGMYPVVDGLCDKTFRDSLIGVQVRNPANSFTIEI